MSSFLIKQKKNRRENLSAFSFHDNSKRHICRMLFCALLACLSVRADENENLIPDSGFETWSSERNLPAGNKWAWNFELHKREIFSVFERSEKEKHTGKFSLHLQGAPGVNAAFYYQLSAAETAKLKGQTLIFSAWIKQIKAPETQNIGIAIWGYDTNKQSISAFEWLPHNHTGETAWRKYIVRKKLPSNTAYLRAYLICKSKNGEPGEAYFDDIALCLESSAYFGEDTEKEGFSIFAKGKLNPHWIAAKLGGDIYYQLAYVDEVKQKVMILNAQNNSGKTLSGLNVYCPYINCHPEIKTPEKLRLFFKAKASSGFNVQLKDGEISALCAVPSTKGKWQNISVPLNSFKGIDKLKSLSNVIFQLHRPLRKNMTFEIAEIRLVPLGEDKIKKCAPEPASALKLEKEISAYPDDFLSDNYSRPEIRNGAFVYKGKLTFFTGPILSSPLFPADWSPWSQNFSNAKYYRELPDQKTLHSFGFNALAFSPANAILAFIFRNNYGIKKRLLTEYEMAKDFLEKLDGMPFFTDLSAPPKQIKTAWQRENAWRPEFEQQNGSWHEFIPLCMKHPSCDSELAKAYQDSAKFLLSNKGNPFVYEIFNEPSYNCRCNFNRKEFALELARKFGDIAKCNELWKSDFKSFKEAAFFKPLEKFPGLWSAWCKSCGTQYALIVRKYINAIKKVDRRKNVYFTEQLVISSIFSGLAGAAMDYMKLAKQVDVLGVEGKWGYGRRISDSETDKSSKVGMMAQVLNSMNAKYSFMLDFYSNLGKNRKPIVDLEHYCARFNFAKRVPSRKNDFATTFWNQIMHGLDGAMLYHWDKRSWEWKTFEEAKANVINGGYKSYSLLNPYNYPRESLDGIRQFQKELAGLEKIVLPKPRRKTPTVGIIYSYPSLRHSALSGRKVSNEMLNLYQIVLYNNYPYRIVMEEELDNPDVSALQILIAPSVNCAYPETLDLLKKYTKNGGVLFLCDDAFDIDENGQKLNPEPLTGNKSFPCQSYCALKNLSENGKKKLFPLRRNLVPQTSRTIWEGDKGACLLTLNKLGKGKVFHFAGPADSPLADVALKRVFKMEGIRKYLNVVPVDSKPLKEVEAHLVDRGETKLVCMVNWESRGSRLIKLQMPTTEPDEKYFVVNHIDKYLYLSPNGKKAWSGKDLNEGILIILPPQQRAIVLLQEKQPERIVSELTENDIRKKFMDIKKSEEPEEKTMADYEKNVLEKERNARTYTRVAYDKCVPIDLRKSVNMAFADEAAADRKGGWTDQGVNDYAQMPLGRNFFANVPFEIIDPSSNGNRSVFVLSGKPRPYFPSKFEGIKIDSKAANIYFLHTFSWGVKKGEPAFIYKINYSDGTTLEAAPEAGKDIAGWWDPQPVSNAKIAHESHNSICPENIGIYCWRWQNPHPEKKIKSIDIVSLDNGGVPIIAGITIEKP